MDARIVAACRVLRGYICLTDHSSHFLKVLAPSFSFRQVSFQRV